MYLVVVRYCARVFNYVKVKPEAHFCRHRHTCTQQQQQQRFGKPLDLRSGSSSRRVDRDLVRTSARSAVCIEQCTQHTRANRRHTHTRARIHAHTRCDRVNSSSTRATRLRRNTRPQQLQPLNVRAESKRKSVIAFFVHVCVCVCFHWGRQSSTHKSISHPIR